MTPFTRFFALILNFDSMLPFLDVIAVVSYGRATALQNWLLEAPKASALAQQAVRNDTGSPNRLDQEFEFCLINQLKTIDNQKPLCLECL